MGIKEVVFFNGQKMPVVGLGTWQSSEEEVVTAIDTALETGYRHIDTAYLYKNEAAIGKALQKWLNSGRIKREELFIVTKLPLIGNRAKSVEKYLLKSLTALQLDYVDLYLIHHPVGLLEKGEDLWPADENGKLLLDQSTDHISLWKAMEAQVDAGRTKSIGLSNFNARQIKNIVKHSRIQPANLQVELHVYFQQRELAAFCKALDITVCAYSPLGSPGLITFMKKSGRDTSSIPNVSLLTDPVVEKIAKKNNKTAAQVLLRHIMQRGIVVIPKSVNPNRIKENFNVFDFELNEEEVRELNALDLRDCGRMFNDRGAGRLDQQPKPSTSRGPLPQQLVRKKNIMKKERQQESPIIVDVSDEESIKETPVRPKEEFIPETPIRRITSKRKLELRADELIMKEPTKKQLKKKKKKKSRKKRKKKKYLQFSVLKFGKPGRTRTFFIRASSFGN